jgi:hypothetical protein
MKFLRSLIPQNRLISPILSAGKKSLGLVSDAMLASYYLSLVEGCIQQQRISTYRKKENDWVEPTSFTEGQLARIQRLASYFPETDFTPIGISS